MTHPREWIDTAGMRQELDALQTKLKSRPTREEMRAEIQRAVQEHTRIERREADPKNARLEANMIELREGVANSVFFGRIDD